ncbi:MAG: hypothetical protein R3325_08265, partial [Thermoanaerobaculia bacterium]|nr:hypothetical protein [Thermoanaerobaculia bacterium]
APAGGADGRPQPGDNELGFVEGRLGHFQNRPRVERGQRLADRVVETLAGERPPSPERVRLDRTPVAVEPAGAAVESAP